MEIKTSVNCVNCDEEIIKQSLYILDDKDVVINVHSFSQTDWNCGKCGHTSCIGDIDVMDLEEL